MIKFAHTIFALPFAGIAVVIALPHSGLLTDGVPNADFFWMMLKLLICMFALRSAAMGFNRLVDRDIDAANPRTAGREIPSGKLSPRTVGLLIAFFLVVFVAAAFWINPLCGFLAPVAIALVLGYSYTKRFTFLCHFVLGLAIGVAPTAAYIALLGRVDPAPLLWSLGLMFYIAGFDILYACQDADFDRESGLHSVPARFGVTPALWVARASHVIALAAFLLAGHLSGTGWAFALTAAIVAGLFMIEHMLVRPGQLERIPIAFFHINASISTVLFLGLVADFLMGA